jgi:hypothetical protein
MLGDGSYRARPTVHFGALALLPAVLSSVFGAEAEQTGKVYRIGFLGGTSAEATPVRSLREGLRELGYVQDRSCLLIGIPRRRGSSSTPSSNG